MNAPNSLHKLLKMQLEKSDLDVSQMPEEEKEKFNILLGKISNFYVEQDIARSRMTNSLKISSEEMARLYKELELKTKKMIFESKMLTLGEMAAGVAHEINNPLAILLSSVELLKESNTEDESSDNYCLLNNIETSVERVRLIVKGLKTFSRNSENDPFQKSSLQEIIKDTLTLCQEKIKRSNIKFTSSIPENALMINCRPAQITQVLVNLLNNSRDAIEGSTDKWINLSVEEDELNFSIKIKDSGLGIPLDIQESLFNPFFTTKPIGLGTGLGLSISKGIIEDHSGCLYVDNNSPNTCFVILIPKPIDP